MSLDYTVEYDIAREEIEEQEDCEDIPLPDVNWAEFLEGIQDRELQAIEIQKAENILKEEKALNDKLDKGEIDFEKCRMEHLHTILPKMRKASTSAELASVGLTPDHIGDVAEDYDFLTTGDLKMTELKDRVKANIIDKGPDAAQEFVDNMLEKEELSKNAHDSISRQVRLQRRSNK